MDILSSRAKSLVPSATLQLVAKAAELTKEGKDVISLSVGEPDWKTYDKISQAGIKAIESGFTKYTPVSGTLDLREAIVKTTEKELGLKWSAKQVVVGTGAKFILFSALQMLLDTDDEVLIQSPYWVSYPPMVQLAGGKPVIVECNSEHKFKLTKASLQAATTKKTKLLILNSPSNPTGLVYTEKELEQIAQYARENPQVYIISDDIYNRLVFTGEALAPHILKIAPDLKSRTLCINGVSKTFSMTGWRIGWAIGEENLIRAMSDYISQSTSSACSISQKASVVALEQCEQDVVHAMKLLKERRDYAVARIRSTPNLDVILPEGAFYLWVNIEKSFGKRYKGHVISNSKDFCHYFLEDYHVTAVPGIEFGTEGYLRVSYTVEMSRLEKAFDRLGKFLGALEV